MIKIYINIFRTTLFISYYDDKGYKDDLVVKLGKRVRENCEFNFSTNN